MSSERFLIVNADDFGQSPSINRGIIAAHRNGIVTSASLMVRPTAAAEAAALSMACSALSVGLHLDLGEWRFYAGKWQPIYEVVSLDDREAVEAEMARQLGAFRELMGRNPTHIDSHQHIHLREPIRSVAEACARDLAVPLRQCDPAIRYCGDFYGQDAHGASLPDRITAEGLIGILERLPPGITELCCHPAVEGGNLETMYFKERSREIISLCDSGVREALARLDIALCSFQDTRA